MKDQRAPIGARIETCRAVRLGLGGRYGDDLYFARHCSYTGALHVCEPVHRAVHDDVGDRCFHLVRGRECSTGQIQPVGLFDPTAIHVHRLGGELLLLELFGRARLRRGAAEGAGGAGCRRRARRDRRRTGHRRGSGARRRARGEHRQRCCCYYWSHRATPGAGYFEGVFQRCVPRGGLSTGCADSGATVGMGGGRIGATLGASRAWLPLTAVQPSGVLEVTWLGREVPAFTGMTSAQATRVAPRAGRRSAVIQADAGTSVGEV
ncbi:protein of unknown function [Micropruina glycogenica]|uniref:Uncharacterized protein n=1 Tax=Micropruina glycogenica TaxID=75385 RepID=A0A2N9JCV0_9ACTN|nr:protein of unknown function [Micropruina glycogenica]